MILAENSEKLNPSPTEDVRILCLVFNIGVQLYTRGGNKSHFTEGRPGLGAQLYPPDSSGV